MIDLLRAPWLPWALLAFVFVVAAVQCLYLWAVLADRDLLAFQRDHWREIAGLAAEEADAAYQQVRLLRGDWVAPPRPPLDPWIPVITVRPRMLARSERRPL